MQDTSWLLLALLLTGCSSLQTYHPGQLGADLPLAAGDAIVLYPEGPDAQPKSLTVISVDADSISGKSAAQGGAILTYRWEEIARIEERRFDRGKTTRLVLLGALLVYAASELGEGLNDMFDSLGAED